MLALALALVAAAAAVHPDDAAAMEALRVAFTEQNPVFETEWPVTEDPCEWAKMRCDEDGRITWIDVDSRDLWYIPAEVGDLSGVERLYFWRNELTALPAEIGQLATLEFLYANDNKIRTLPTALFGATNIRQLSLSDNLVSWLPAELGDLTGLELAFLSRNQIKNIPDTVAALTSVTNLALDTNKIREVPAAVGMMTALTDLDFGGNLLSELPDELANLVNLDIFDIRGNRFTEVPSVVETLFAVAPMSRFVIADNFISGPVPAYIEESNTLFTASCNCFEDSSAFSIVFGIDCANCNPERNGQCRSAAYCSKLRPIMEVSWTDADNCAAGITVEGDEITPDAGIAIVYSRNNPSAGTANVPAGSPVCAGEPLGVGQPFFNMLGQIADEEGDFVFETTPPASACGFYAQLVDLETCIGSDVWQF